MLSSEQEILSDRTREPVVGYQLVTTVGSVENYIEAPFYSDFGREMAPSIGGAIPFRVPHRPSFILWGTNFTYGINHTIACRHRFARNSGTE